MVHQRTDQSPSALPALCHWAALPRPLPLPAVVVGETLFFPSSYPATLAAGERLTSHNPSISTPLPKNTQLDHLIHPWSLLLASCFLPASSAAYACPTIIVFILRVTQILISVPSVIVTAVSR